MCVCGQIQYHAGLDLVPLLAGDLAGLAAGADGGVDEHTASVLRHVYTFPFSILHVNALASWIETFGSATKAEVLFAMSLVEIPM